MLRALRGFLNAKPLFGEAGVQHSLWGAAEATAVFWKETCLAVTPWIEEEHDRSDLLKTLAMKARAGVRRGSKILLSKSEQHNNTEREGD